MNYKDETHFRLIIIIILYLNKILMKYELLYCVLDLPIETVAFILALQPQCKAVKVKIVLRKERKKNQQNNDKT